MAKAKFGKMDVKGLKDLQRRLERLQPPDDFVESCAKALARELLRMAISRTPVGQYPGGSGKTGGTLRRGWTAGTKDSPNAVKVNHFGRTYVIEVLNEVEYAIYVEYGHRTRKTKEGKRRWVEGRKMLTISVRELEGIAPAILERKIAAYLREIGGD